MIHFFDKKSEKKLLRDGYVVVDVLGEEEVGKLRSLYFDHKQAHLSQYGNTHNTSDTRNKELVKHIDKSIEKILKPILNNLLSSYDYMLSSFMVKEPGEDNVTGFHQDPTLIDKENKTSANIWIALQDTDTSNGCLQFIKGSHRMGNILVVTPRFPTIFEQFADKLPFFITHVPLKSGQGVIFDNRLIHAASPNNSKEERIAVVAALKSAGCDWVYYYMEQSTKVIEKYAIDYEAYTDYPKDRRPECKMIGQFTHEFEQMSYSEFIIFMLKNYPLETLRNLARI